VADECDDGGGGAKIRRTLRRVVNMRRPGGAPLEQHPRHRRKWLRGNAGRIEKPPAIEVIAGLRTEDVAAANGQKRTKGRD
jgi:hypothetical protein